MREKRESLSVQESIQTRLSLAMVLVMLFVVCINFFIFEQIHSGVNRIDAVFSSNAAINDLSDTLNKLEGTVYEYLNTKGTKALENYYRYEQDYRQLLDELNDRNVESEVKMLEKNIRRMSESYLEQTSETVQAKRGRNIEKYKASYEKEKLLYEYITSYIYKLNNLRFRMNSANYQILLNSMDVLYRLALVVIFIVAAVGVAIILLVVRSMIRPLTQLSNTAHEVAMGNLDVPILPVVCEDEVGVVTRGFNQMLDSIRVHITQQRENMEKQAQMKERELLMETHLKEAQLKYLQAQINPHFLYNVLNIISGRGIENNDDMICDMCGALASMLRYSTNNKERYVKTEQEMNYLENYLYLLRARYGDKISFDVSIDSAVRDKLLPKMTLHQFVENILAHAYGHSDRRMIIQVSGTMYSDHWEIRVQDNGEGISEEKLREIREKIKNVRKNLENRGGMEMEIGGMGLVNTYARCFLLYHDALIFSIRNLPSGGVEVTVGEWLNRRSEDGISSVGGGR